MKSFLDALSSGPSLSSPLDVGIRLLLALLFGAMVAWLYKTTRPPQDESSFPPTLVLLAVLIAMVTQVIGDNVARAFSLVGALSIVRFRTVVRDTEDTAYVIFAVVVGMAVGAHNLTVAALGVPIIGLAAFVMRRSATPSAPASLYAVTVRLGLAQDADTLSGIFRAHASSTQLRGVTTARQGLAVDFTYDVRLAPASSAQALVKALNRADGVQSVDLQQRAIVE
jgi:hypothetical protein